jgi:hypothetical protein
MLLNLLKNILPRHTPPAPAVPDDDAQLELRRIHDQMAQAALPGPVYMKSIAAVHAMLRPRTYLEIGVESGKTLALAAPFTRAIGVDPAPKIKQVLGDNARIFKLTSDEFFAQVDVTKELAGLPVDLAFIDGMHLFEFALRDFVAIERLCSTASTVLIHDTYPLNRLTADRERTTLFWSGDIWRVVMALKKYRPDLSIHTIATAPTGLTLIRGLDPGSRVLGQRLTEIVSEFMALDYAALDADKPAALNLYPNEPDRLAALLA